MSKKHANHCCITNILTNFASEYITQVSDVKKIEEDKGRYAAFGGEDRGQYFGKRGVCIKTNVIYLLLYPSTSFYLKCKRNLRKLNYY